MYEHRRQPLLPPRHFLLRLGAHVTAALTLILIFLAIGTVGYHALGRLAWLDAFLNAAMLLGGMGQVGNVDTTDGKVFAAIFALISGLLLVVVTTIILAPVLHRILHKIHMENPKVDESAEG